MSSDSQIFSAADFEKMSKEEILLATHSKFLPLLNRALANKGKVRKSSPDKLSETMSGLIDGQFSGDNQQHQGQGQFPNLLSQDNGQDLGFVVSGVREHLKNDYERDVNANKIYPQRKR